MKPNHSEKAQYTKYLITAEYPDTAECVNEQGDYPIYGET